MKKLLASILIGLIILGVVSGFFRHVDEPDAEFLATDLYFNVGDQIIVSPAVAQRSTGLSLPTRFFDNWDGGDWFESKPYKKALLAIASNPNFPASTAFVQLQLGAYGSYGETSRSNAICPLLTHQWAQFFCAEYRPNGFPNVPRRFTLYARNLASYSPSQLSHASAWDIDVLKVLAGGAVSFVVKCQPEDTVCLAGVAITPKLVAVWSTQISIDQKELAEEVGETQGAALARFVMGNLVVSP